MRGLHLTADLHGCRCERTLMTSVPRLAQVCRALVDRVGLTPVGECFHPFDAAGVTGVVLLAESHLAIHTWPELQAATLDVYVCNVTRDNSASAQALMDALVAAFDPQDRTLNRVQRGELPPRPGSVAPAGPVSLATAGAGSNALLLEWLTDDAAFGFRIRRQLERRDSTHQRIEMVETPAFGTVMRIDGRYMTSDGDEFHYHEAMVHPAAIGHPRPRRGLIVGGGDGGSAEELLKHPSIERIDLVELDADVVELSRRHLQAVHRGALDDPRVAIRVEDGARFVADSTDRYDVIVLDLTDPDTAAAHLYGERFFRDLAARLAPGGTVSLHLGSPIHGMLQVLGIVDRLRAAFPVVRPMGTFVPLYGTYWAFAIAACDRDPAELPVDLIRQRLAERAVGDLRLYHAAMHAALFTLPAYFTDRLAAAGGCRGPA